MALQAATSLEHDEPVLEYVSWGEELGQLTSGHMDLVFLQSTRDHVDERLEMAPLVEMRRVAVFAAKHPLARRTSVDIDDLIDEPIIDAASDRDYWIVNPRPGGGQAVTVGPPARTVDEMLAFVAAGRGMAITSSSVADRYESPDLAFVPIVNLDAGMLYLASLQSDSRPEVAAMQSETSSLIRTAAQEAEQPAHA
jgi:DNA-binding transcriptional LysR family regulator